MKASKVNYSFQEDAEWIAFKCKAADFITRTVVTLSECTVTHIAQRRTRGRRDRRDGSSRRIGAVIGAQDALRHQGCCARVRAVVTRAGQREGRVLPRFGMRSRAIQLASASFGEPRRYVLQSYDSCSCDWYGNHKHLDHHHYNHHQNQR